MKELMLTGFYLLSRHQDKTCSHKAFGSTFCLHRFPRPQTHSFDQNSCFAVEIKWISAVAEYYFNRPITPDSSDIYSQLLAAG